MSLFKQISAHYIEFTPQERLAGIILIISVLLPHIGILYIVNPILLLYLAFKFPKTEVPSPFQIIMVFLIVLSLCWNMFYGIPIDFKSIIRGIYIVELLVLFPYIGNVQFRNVYIYIIVVVILLSQLAFVYGIGVIISIMDFLYPYTGDVVSESTDYLLEHSANATSLSDLQNIRFGGLFHNSNQCMKYISMCSIIYAIENLKTPIKLQLPFWAIVFSSALLSGSRTGFVIVFATVALMFFLRKRQQVSIKAIFLPAVFIIITFYCVSEIFSSQFRMFDIKDGTSDGGSIVYKYANFAYYNNIVTEARQILVGNFDVDSICTVYHTPFSQFDSEWGNAVYFYGYFFIVVYFTFLIKTIGKLRGINIIAILLFFWIISSTVLFSYRTSFAFFLILSRCVCNSKQLKNDTSRK
ncbi:hypothetical protein [Bacteroides nordii]|uniref:hypothetical protein n=1 Tax=Bacteroides nordii TaxID=291645 RepID=UPI00242D4967|nr:hypothetical protein [Bacteroides nordii]